MGIFLVMLLDTELVGTKVTGNLKRKNCIKILDKNTFLLEFRNKEFAFTFKSWTEKAQTMIKKMCAFSN